MRRKLSQYLIMMLVACLALNCASSGDEVSFDQEKALVKLSLKEDLTTVKGETKGGASLIYKVVVLDKNDDVVVSYDDHTAIGDDGILLRPGEYTFKASCGELVDAGFEKPYYEGSTRITVVKGNRYTVEITCYLANVKATMTTSDVIKENFSVFELSVSNTPATPAGLDPAKTLVFDYTTETESKAGYFKATGMLTYELYIVNNNGTANTIKRTIDNVKPREHYRFNFSILPGGDDEPGGLNNIVIIIDESLNDVEHQFVINLDSEGAPEITGSGHNLNAPIELLAGSTDSFDINVSASKAIQSLFVEHTSDYAETLGIPKSFDVMSVDDITKTQINAAGFAWAVSVGGENSVTLNFGGMLAKLPAGTHNFTLTVEDELAQKVTQPLEFVISDTEPQLAMSATGVDAWARFANITAQWISASQPQELAFKYKKASESEWTTIPEGQLTFSGNRFSAKATYLDDNTVYEVKAVCAGEETAAIQFTTERAYQIPGMGFDQWCIYTDNKSQMPNPDNSDANRWWDSGNRGANTIGTNNPTVEEKSFVMSGSAAKLSSKTVFGVFAAGSIFTGKFIEVVELSGAALDFGVPYTSRPNRMTGYYNYAPGTIDKTSSNYGDFKDKTDSCHIYVVLTDWDGPFRVNTKKSIFIDLENDSKIIAFGELKTNKTSETGVYQKFSIDLKYRNQRKPTYAVIVSAASKYGDYFTGSTKSVLYLDEYAFEFDPE